MLLFLPASIFEIFFIVGRPECRNKLNAGKSYQRYDSNDYYYGIDNVDSFI